jgi:YXWGXW repeat-containing protein
MRTFLKCASLLLLSLCFLVPAPSSADVAISVRVGPPALPVYTQPPCPEDGYLWTPGYWAYADAGYYWVPGVWVAPPRVGVLWTPGYWGFAGGLYAWHAGYWGPHVGFYGGINYGFGYGGVGFVGGHWMGGHFAYNTAVVNVNRTVVRNVYVNRTVIRNTTVVNRVSFNGEGGVVARPTAREESFAHEQHFEPTANQFSHEHSAAQDRNQFASSNHGRPNTVAMDSVNGRRYNQQQRIANGIRSGQMTPGEAARAEHHEQNINRHIAADRSANGGRLTQQERQNINQRQNSASRQIYNEKHNDKTDHGR